MYYERWAAEKRLYNSRMTRTRIKSESIRLLLADEKKQIERKSLIGIRIYTQQYTDGTRIRFAAAKTSVGTALEGERAPAVARILKKLES